MKRSPHQAPARKPAVKTRVGPNWKLLVHFCIIAGLLYAISIAWQNLGEAKAKREAENRQAAALKAQAYEEAKAEARRQAAARETPALPTLPEIPASDVPAQVETPQETIDRPETTAAPVEKSDPGPEFAALTSRARELVIAVERKRGAQLAENSRTLLWDLDVWLRSLPKTEQADWLPHVARIKSASSHGRVPHSIPESSGILLSRKMAEFTTAAAAKQSRIDMDFLSETGKIHRAYLAKIQEAITQAEGSGQTGTAAALGRASESAANLESWLHSLGVDFQSADDSPLTE
jgi:hypothetical protein